MNKRRRSERLKEKQHEYYTPQQRVIHHKYLWMEIGKWHIDAFIGLSRITKAPQGEETLDFRKALVRGFLTVREVGCLHGGTAYNVFCNDSYFNPFGPLSYHSCPGQTSIRIKGVKYYRRGDDTWWTIVDGVGVRSTLAEQAFAERAIDIYRYDPLAEFFFKPFTPPQQSSIESS